MSTHSLGRRSLLRATGSAALVTAAPLSRSGRAAAPERLFDLASTIDRPIEIDRIEVLKSGDRFLVRARAEGDLVGYAVPNQHASYVAALFNERVAPFFAGKDARDLEALVDGVYVHASNYKIVGVPFWIAVSWAELALLDLLGRLAGKPVHALLGGSPLRRSVPMYLSSTDRGTSPEEEVARFEAKIATTGARAVKFKVGGRMSGNADASLGRTETLVRLVRKRLGDQVTLYADANGSFDVAKGIAVGRLLEEHGVAIYEEPCPFEDYASTRKVTAALRRIKVAGGEQDTSWLRFQEIVRDRVVDVVQPDLSYNGGFVRAMRVARLAARAGLSISPHCPDASTMLYTLHFAAFTKNLGEFQEIHVTRADTSPWFAPDLRMKAGALAIPTGPGLGLTIDPALLKAATAVR